MLRQMTALVIALLLALTAVPAALAAESWSARTPLSDDADKLVNLRLAVQAIDGASVAAGASFSFNEAVGPREKRRGYREAPNGRSVMVTGGGVAQAASTLYMALLQMDEDAVEIDPVKTYGKRFSDDYVQNPSLAIVTDYDAGIDLSFTNLTDETMTIDMWLGDDDLWCVVTTGQKGGLGALSGDSKTSLFFDEDDDAGDGLPVDIPLDGVGAWSMEEEEEDGASSRMINLPHFDDDEPGSLGSASINCGGNKDVLHNVSLAAACINDTMLDSGDTFSFNDVVGPRTKKYGYRRAVNGRGAKVLGGGVAQVASALWLAIEDCDDIRVIEKSTYGKHYNQRYVSDAADAILTDYASGRDFRFRYTGDSSLTIYAYVDDGWLYCEVYEG